MPAPGDALALALPGGLAAGPHPAPAHKPSQATGASTGPNGEWPVVGKRFPTACQVSIDGTANPANAYLRRLRALHWIERSATRAVAVGAALPNHYPFDPYRVRVVVRAPRPSGCGRQFTQIIITSRWGRGAGTLPSLSCGAG